MKNRFALTCLVLVASVSTAVAAEVLGVLPQSVSAILKFPAILGWSTAAGVVAMAWRDYAPAAMPVPRSARKRTHEATHGERPVAKSDTAWVHQTVSA